MQRVRQPVPVLGEERLVQVVALPPGPACCWRAATGRRTARRPGCPAPGTRAAKITKLATSRLASSIASLRAKNRQSHRLSRSRPGCSPTARTCRRTTPVAPVRLLLSSSTLVGWTSGIHGSSWSVTLLGLRPARPAGPGWPCCAACSSSEVSLRVVEVVVVLRAAGQGERGQQRGRVRVVAVVHGQEPVDALPGVGVGEEVDVVLRRDRLERWPSARSPGPPPGRRRPPRRCWPAGWRCRS